jgi:hypothetical protein
MVADYDLLGMLRERQAAEGTVFLLLLVEVFKVFGVFAGIGSGETGKMQAEFGTGDSHKEDTQPLVIGSAGVTDGLQVGG